MPNVSITYPEVVTSINLGTTEAGSQKIGGVVDLTSFLKLKSFFGKNLDLTDFTNFNHMNTFENVQLDRNLLSGNPPDLSGSPGCKIISLNDNRFAGGLNQTIPTGIQAYRIYKNSLSSSTSYDIPALGTYSSLAEYNISQQSDSYDGVNNSSNPKWNGPVGVVTEFTVPTSMRVFNVSKTRLAKIEKIHILAAFQHAFQSFITAGTTINNTVNGITYTPQIRVNGATAAPTGSAALSTCGKSLTYLTGLNTALTVSTVKSNLQGIGFTISGI